MQQTDTVGMQNLAQLGFILFCFMAYQSLLVIQCQILLIHIYHIYMICKDKSTKLNSLKYCYVSLTIQLNIIHLFTHS